MPKISFEWTQTSDGQMRCDGDQLGAAGILFHHPETNTYLLGHRSPEVHQGDTWGIPGGAIDPGEEPYQAALREAQEEFGHVPQHKVTGIHKVVPVPDWAYHTVVADVTEQFEPEYDHSWETQGHGWFTPEEIQKLKLHPGFAAAWNSGALGPRTSKHGFFYHVAPRQYREQIEQQGLLPSQEAPESPWTKARDSWLKRIDQPSGVYLHDDPRNAIGYAYNLQSHKDQMFPGDQGDFNEEDYDWSGQPDYDIDPEDHKNFEPVYKPQAAYDIWKVNTLGVPVDIDPESALLRGELTAEEAQKRINDDIAHGYASPPNPTEGHHWFTPHAVPPERIALHQSVYPHEMTEENYYDTLDNKKQIPEAWQRVPLNEWNEKAQQRYLGDSQVMREIDPIDR